MTDSELVAAIQKVGACLATAESCTGGLIARRITAVAGSSQAFWGAWVTYDNSAKSGQLGIPPELISRFGAVSAEVAGAMAEAGLAAMENSVINAAESGLPGATSLGGSRVRICVSTTGIAGPTGGTETKPVGLCFIGIAATGLPTAVMEIRGKSGLRDQNQQEFADSALQAVSKLVNYLTCAPSKACDNQREGPRT